MSVDPRAGSNNTGAGLPEEAAEGGYHFLYKFMVSITIHGEFLVFEYERGGPMAKYVARQPTILLLYTGKRSIHLATPIPWSFFNF